MYHKFLRFFFVLILTFGLVAIQAPQPARAASAWYVATTGDDSNDCLSPATACATINGAIGKALSGDTAYVAVGTYTGIGSEVVLIDKDITLSGGWDASFTTQSETSIIDGGGARTGIVVRLSNPKIITTVEHFTIQNGYGTYGSPTAGGGIVSDGNLTLANTILQNNRASYGAGLYNSQTTSLNNSTISNNMSDGAGGGIYNDGTLTLNSTTVSGNTSSGGGGGLLNSGMLILNNSTLSGNTGSNGGGVYNNFGGIVILNKSAINGNLGGSDGGGIYLYGGTLALTNSTISGNSVIDRGGGISVSSGTVYINNSTFSKNKTTSTIYGGGAIFNSGATVILRNSIIAGNTTGGMGPDCNGFNPIDSAGYNLIGDTSNCFFTPSTGDLTDIDPNLGLLMGPEGVPAYHPLIAGSPAIDAGNPAGCADQEDSPLPTDQRGVARVGTCDIGAYEYTVPGSAVSLSVVGGDKQSGITNLAFPQALQVAALDSQGSPVSGVTVDFMAPGSGASGTFTDTSTNSTSVNTDGGGVATTSTFTANSQAGAYTVSASTAGLGSVSFNLEQIAGAANDQFAGATVINSLPFDDTVDTATASTEAGEPTPSCAPNGLFNTVWYAFTPDITGSISANNSASTFNPVLAVYTGDSLASLTEVGCQMNGTSVSFLADGGTTYYFQAGGEKDSGYAGEMLFHVEVTPPPIADFYFYPSNPSAFDTIAFSDTSFDPGQAGYQSFSWDFGDGTSITGPESFANHQYTQDGNYTIQHSVTTVDGRTASTSQVVQVRTHDIAIAKITAPKSANSGQTKAITVAIRNTRYPETITVDLYKSTPGGDVWIDSLTLPVPVLSGNKTKLFTFNYTFTVQDAQIGKVTFKAIASIAGANDVFPSDNTGISSPPTKVSR